MVSVFVLFIWLSLGIYSGYKSFVLLPVAINDWLIIGAHAIVIVVTIAVCFMMISRGQTHKGEHNPNMIERVTKIGN